MCRNSSYKTKIVWNLTESKTTHVAVSLQACALFRYYLYVGLNAKHFLSVFSHRFLKT